MFDKASVDEAESGKCSSFDFGQRVAVEKGEGDGTTVMWHVKWTMGGLQPVKPQVVFTNY